jgi:prepilin-type N-terminal cleavage/methylation domain-containing protein
MIRKGFSFTEILIATAALAVISLSMADFTANTFKVAYDHAVIVEKADQTRLSSELISNEINKSSYIFPAGYEISIQDNNGETVINTDNAIAFLIQGYYETDPPSYRLKAYYLKEGSNGKYDLYEFTGSSESQWSANEVPADIFYSNYGRSSLLLSDISLDSCRLSYILNYGNGITDSNLKGSIANASSNDANALIKGFEWNMEVEKKRALALNINGVSKNVPRFID